MELVDGRKLQNPTQLLTAAEFGIVAPHATVHTADVEMQIACPVVDDNDSAPLTDMVKKAHEILADDGEGRATA